MLRSLVGSELCIRDRRIGVQEMTRMGMKESEMGEIAQLMGAAMNGKDVLQQVGRLREQFTEVQFC